VQNRGVTPSSFGPRAWLVGQAIAGRLANPNFSPDLKNVQIMARLAVAAADAALDLMAKGITEQVQPVVPKPISGNLKCGCYLEGWNPQCIEHTDYAQWTTARDLEIKTGII
jgi:hypothetical protein